jgi:hypothetical protein
MGLVFDRERVFMHRFIGLYVILCLALFGCSTEKISPAGRVLLGRDPGQVVTVPAIGLESGASFQEVLLPIILGQREEILTGQMNGFQFQSLFRFRIPVDSLAQLAGGSAADFVAGAVSVKLGLRGERLINQAQVVILQPDQEWGEIQTFVDSLTRSERVFPASLILGATGQVSGDTSLVIDLPISYFDAARLADASAPQLDFMVAPDGIGDFLLDIVTREGLTISALGRQPQLVVPYRVGGVSDTFRVGAAADTYWGRRVDGGPRKELLIVSKGTFYSSILNFTMPSSIPRGATVNSAELELDLDLDHSYFTALPFEMYHVEFETAVDDTTYTIYNTQAEVNPTTTVKVVFNQSLIQGWTSGAQINQGVAIRAVGTPIDFTWLVIRDARLNIIYSTPPEL